MSLGQTTNERRYPVEYCSGKPGLDIHSCDYARFLRIGETFDPNMQCMYREETDPPVQCMRPADITEPELRVLRRAYATFINQGGADRTKRSFWEFVEENRLP